MRRRAFTLVESLLTLVLVGIVLGAIGVLLQMYANIMRHSQGRVSSTDCVMIALDAVRCDVAQALAIQVPAPGANGSTLSLRRLDPYSANVRLPSPIPSGPGPWAPHQASFVVNVTYRLVAATPPEDSQFQRITVYSDGFTDSEVACRGLNTVLYQRNPDGTVEVTATSQPTNQALFTLSTTAGTHLPATLYP